MLTYAKKEGAFGVLTICWDDTPLRDVHVQIFGKKPVLSYNSQASFEAGFSAEEHKAATRYVMRRLTLKSCSTVELKKCLKERLVSDETAEKIIAECERLGYVNDADWIAGFVRQHIAQNAGTRKIIQKLKMKGFAPEDYAHHFSHSETVETQTKQITRLLETKYRTRDLSDFKTRNKVIASLMRKGFSLDVILDRLD